MVAALPVEIVDLILRLSLQHGYSREQQARPLSLSDAASTSPPAPSHEAEPPIDARQATTLSILSRRYRDTFQQDLYRHVALLNHRSLELFARTIDSRSDLSTKVRSLVVLRHDTDVLPVNIGGEADSGLESAAPPQTVADVVLSACPNASHLLLSCDQFACLSTGLYKLRRPKDLTLVNVTHVDDFLGIVMRHRDLTAATLQSDPRIQAILGTITATQGEQATQLADSSSPASTSHQTTLAPRAERSLSHLHLVNFDTRLLHRLVTLSSLTHLVLSHPPVPERRPGAPGLSVIPRSHLMLLLSSGNIARIIIRADLSTCIRIMEEITPIEDSRLVFRPVSPSSHGTMHVTRLGSDVAALHASVVASEVNLLAEFYNRLRPKARRDGSSTSSAEDADTSRDSLGLTSHGRFSDGSAGGTSQGRSSDSSGVGTSQSASTGSGDDHRDDDQASVGSTDDYDLDDEDALDDEDEDEDAPPVPARGVSTHAPPLNIPIEELLRSERFTPAGLGAPTTPSSRASSATEYTRNASPSTHQSRRQRITRQSAFTLRRTDLRGATQQNIDLCTRLYEALSADAGSDAPAAQSEINFW